MSVDLGALIDRIPQDKLSELVGTFTDGTTVQQVLDFLSAVGVEATEEEAQTLMASLLPDDDGFCNLSDEDLEMVAGGKVALSGPILRKLVFANGSEKWVLSRCPFCNY